MWNLIRIVILSLAFVGFVGQTTAKATPFPMEAAMADMSDCAQMMSGHANGVSEPGSDPCKDMTPGCIAKMGCAVVAPVFSPQPSATQLRVMAPPAFGRVSLRLAGIETAPLKHPPRPRL